MLLVEKRVVKMRKGKAKVSSGFIGAEHVILNTDTQTTRTKLKASVNAGGTFGS